MNENRGIVITGGTVNADAMAAGEKSTAQSVTQIGTTPSLDNARSQMADLVEAVRARAAALEDGDQSLTVAKLAQRELAKQRPDKRSFLGLLESLASGVGSVTSLATAVTAIQQAVTAVL